MAVTVREIKTLEELNEWIDKAKKFAESNWGVMDHCDITFEHTPVFTGKDHGLDTWREGERAMMIIFTTKDPKNARHNYV